MLSKTEKLYLRNTREFEKTHSEGYVRKIRCSVRKKAFSMSCDILELLNADICRDKDDRRKTLIDFGSVFEMELRCRDYTDVSDKFSDKSNW